MYITNWNQKYLAVFRVRHVSVQSMTHLRTSFTAEHGPAASEMLMSKEAVVRSSEMPPRSSPGTTAKNKLRKQYHSFCNYHTQNNVNNLHE